MSRNQFVKGGKSTWKHKVKCAKMIVSLCAVGPTLLLHGDEYISKYLFTFWTLQLFPDAHGYWQQYTSHPVLWHVSLTSLDSLLSPFLFSFFNFKKKSKHKYVCITFGGFGLLIQGAGLAPKAFSGAIDPDVGDHAGVTLRQTHVLLAHGLVEPGAEWSWCHVHLEEDRRRMTFAFLITPRQI